MKDTVLARLAALKTSRTIDLKQQWRDLFESEPPPYNRRFLEHRLAYRIQELAYGGLKPGTPALLGRSPPSRVRLGSEQRVWRGRRRGHSGRYVSVNDNSAAALLMGRFVELAVKKLKGESVGAEIKGGEEIFADGQWHQHLLNRGNL